MVQKTQKLKMPGPKTLNPLGFATEIERDTFGFTLRMWREYGDFVTFPFLGKPACLLFHPDAVKQILQSQNYDKHVFILEALKIMMGNGIFTSDGEEWSHNRKLINPAFHKKRLASLVDVMSMAAQDTLNQCSEDIAASRPVDILEKMTALSLRITSEALFSIDLSNGNDTALAGLYQNLLPLLTSYITKPMPPYWVPTQRNRDLLRKRQVIDELIYDMIKEFQKKDDQPDNLLSWLLKAQDDEGHRFSAKQIRDEMITMLIAGQDTTAAVVTWTFYAISQDSEIERRVQEELQSVLAGTLPTFERLSQLPYLTQVVQEALRLYPSTFALARRAINEDDVCGYKISKGTTVILSPYFTQRHPDFWENPEKFDPERFQAGKTLYKFSYLPFGGGPRICIGQHFALMEAQIILACFLQKYTLRVVPEDRIIRPKILISMRPEGGMPMSLQTRENVGLPLERDRQ